MLYNPYKGGLGIMAYYDMAYDEYAIRIEARYHHENKILLAKDLTLEEVKLGSYPEPTLRLRPEAVQHLFNDLWMQGFRPKDGTGNGGHLDAIKYHLEDMRKLVFK